MCVYHHIVHAMSCDSGDPTIFGNRSEYNDATYRWANVSETLVPVVW